MTADPQQSYVLGSWTLLALFCGRVLAQFVQRHAPVDYLPAFEQWQGSGLPYGWLLAGQIAILVTMFWFAMRLRRRRLVPRPVLGRALLLAGAVYLAGKTARLGPGLTLMTHPPWFAKPLPAVFHMVLACYILMPGRLHCHLGQKGNATC